MYAKRDDGTFASPSSAGLACLCISDKDWFGFGCFSIDTNEWSTASHRIGLVWFGCDSFIHSPKDNRNTTPHHITPHQVVDRYAGIRPPYILSN